jgi:hypothetical protein
MKLLGFKNGPVGDKKNPSILSQLFDESPKVAQSEIKFRLHLFTARLEL